MLFENPRMFSVINHLLDHNVSASGVAGSLRFLNVVK